MHTLSDLDLPGGVRTTLQGCPGGGPGDPVLLLLPAMGVAAGYYGPFVAGLADEGVAATVLDYPGQGTSEPRVGRDHDYGYADLADAWLDAALDCLGELFPRRPVVLLGHSLGGQVVLARLAHDRRDVAGVVLLGSGSPYWRAQPAALTLLGQTQLMGLVTRLLGHWPGHRLGFGGRQPRRLVAEWSRFARTGRLAPAARPVEDRLADVDLPVLAVDLDGDRLAPPSSVDHLLGKLPSARVERWHFRKQPGDPGRPVDHYSFARSPEIIAARVAGWSRDHAGSHDPRRP